MVKPNLKIKKYSLYTEFWKDDGNGTESMELEIIKEKDGNYLDISITKPDYDGWAVMTNIKFNKESVRQLIEELKEWESKL